MSADSQDINRKKFARVHLSSLFALINHTPSSSPLLLLLLLSHTHTYTHSFSLLPLMPSNEIQANPPHSFHNSPSNLKIQPTTYLFDETPQTNQKPKKPKKKKKNSINKLMGKNKIKSSSSSPPWPWATCGGNKLNTLSFRADGNDDAFRTFNSAFLDTQLTPDYNSFFTVCSSSSRSFSTIMSEDSGDPVESVIRGLRSDRLFFEPETTNSLIPLSEDKLNICGFKFAAESEHEHMLKKGESESESEEEEGGGGERVVYKESEMLAMESNNPFEDFRRSMEEMVEAHGLKDWQGLEELLRCYLKINGEKNHGFIMGAFIDLLVTLSLSSSSSSSTTTTTTPLSTSITPSTTSRTTTTTSTSSSSLSSNNSPSSPLSLPSSSLSSSLTNPCLSSILDDDDDDDGDDHDHVSY